MNILVASERDIKELVQVEIESKKQSIPECIEDYELDYSQEFIAGQHISEGKRHKHQNQKE